MRSHISTLLLLVVLALAIGDLAVRLRPVHAQNSPRVYITGYSTRGSGGQPLTIRGREIVGFSCAEETCYVLKQVIGADW